MFRETVVRGLRMGAVGEEKEDKEDDEGGEDDGDGGGRASNVKIEGVACSSTKLGSRLGELKGETAVESCWNLAECSGGRVGDDDKVKGLAGGVPQIVLR
jgi:hypothetical protein